MPFARKIENFDCEHCGIHVVGDGYTNHCSDCLWSKHVDIDPGDRANSCMGLMEPIRTELKNRELRIIHRCIKCGYEKANRVSQNDNHDMIIKITENVGEN